MDTKSNLESSEEMTELQNPTPENHPFSEFVRILGRGKKSSRSMDFDEAQRAMTMIMNGEAEDLQLGAFLMLLRVKEESGEEMAGFVKGCQSVMNAPEINVDIDWSSYAGKRRHLPWFILAICALANAGYRIFIHGSDGHTEGRIYTNDVFRKLGLPIANDFNQVSQQLDEHHLSYLHLSNFLPRLDEIMQYKHLFALRSPVNSFVRMLNPLKAKLVMQGVFHPVYNGIHQQACTLLEYPNVCIIKGDGGETERNPEMKLTSYQVLDGIESEQHWDVDMKKRQVKPTELHIEELVQLWRAETPNQYGERAIITTLAATLQSLKQVDQAEALILAEGVWENRNMAFLG